MINQEDYTMIADYDCMGVDERGKILEQKGDQVLAKSQIILLVSTMNYYMALSHKDWELPNSRI